MKRVGGWAATAIVLYGMGISTVRAGDAAPGAACAGKPVANTKFSREFDGSIALITVAFVGTQHKGQARPQYDTPNAPGCLLEQFKVGKKPVSVIFHPWQKGEQTLHYQFLAGAGDGKREFLVLYSAFISLMYDGAYFYMSETTGPKFSVYAIFNGQPDYATLKELVSGVLNGSEPPLIAAERPDDSDQMIVTVFDDKRLK